jgi:hypothetical protein
MFEETGRLPYTSIGLWVFPAGAFQRPTTPNYWRHCRKFAIVYPGLFLFQV